MPLSFRSRKVDIPVGTGARALEDTIVFDRRILSDVGVVVTGFKFDYYDSDHHMNVVEASVSIVQRQGNAVRFRVNCQYADKNFDDRYHGYVTVMAIADIAEQPGGEVVDPG